MRREPPSPWWVRLLARLLEGEIDRGAISVRRSLTYHECLQLGCTEQDARDYVQRAIEDPFTITWRGHVLVRTKAARPNLPKGLRTQ